MITGCKESGVFSHGQGSQVVVRGGSIAETEDGVCCQEGGHADMQNVTITGCKDSGVLSLRQGKAVVRGGSIAKSKRGVCCQEGGHAEVRDVKIKGCKLYGLWCISGSLQHIGCNISNCGKGSTSGCRA